MEILKANARGVSAEGLQELPPELLSSVMVVSNRILENPGELEAFHSKFICVSHGTGEFGALAGKGSIDGWHLRL
ncbi:MAG: hypothetical protein M3O82_08175 [Verrucomicrobiota bacterium]|nr:hypothetical protein [Verrucomicrobiota bacterium]